MPDLLHCGVTDSNRLDIGGKTRQTLKAWRRKGGIYFFFFFFFEGMDGLAATSRFVRKTKKRGEGDWKAPFYVGKSKLMTMTIQLDDW